MMKWQYVIFSAILCIHTIEFAVSATTARWCTISNLEFQKCEAMKTAFTQEGLTPTISCVQSESKDDCMSKIANDQADLVTLDGGEIHSGGIKNSLLPIMEEVYAGGKTGYYGLAVVRKTNTDVNYLNLRDKKTCHTGYGRSAGWNIPVGFMLEEKLMPALACQGSLQSAAAFFNESCVPGALAAAPEGVDVSNLCALCDDPGACSRSNDLYASYTGAFRCLVEQNADVAFIKTETVIENTGGNNQEDWAKNLNIADFEILCRDGTRRPVSDDVNCHTAKSPSHAVVTSGDKSEADIKSYVDLLNKAVEIFGVDDNSQGFSLFDSDEFAGGKDLLFKDTTQSLNTLDVENAQDFLGEEYVGSLDGLKACPPDTLRFCTISDGEQTKCQAMRDAFTSSQITPEISCYQASSHVDCMGEIAANFADLVTLDSGDIYKAGKDYNLAPVMSESYDGTSGDVSYWAVAVAKASSSFTINDLEGKKSCHTGIMKTSGWIVPIGYLVNEDMITVTDCDTPGAVADFFSQSCVPGALDDKYNPAGTNPDSLCNLCIGEGDNHCVRNDNEPYYDYSGAFRCLVQGGGDVAFIKHLTIGETIDNAKVGEWSYGLDKTDYQYLCPDGSRSTTWNEACSLSKVSAHAMVTRPSGDMTDTIVAVFTAGQGIYGNDQTPSGTFKLFDSADYSGNDLLFKDSTITLQSVGNKNTYDKYLTEEFIKGIETVEPMTCGAINNGMTALFLTAVLFVAHALIGGGA